MFGSRDEEAENRNEERRKLHKNFFESWNATIGTIIQIAHDSWGDPKPGELGVIMDIISHDLVFAEWDGKGRGTWHMCNLADTEGVQYVDPRYRENKD